MERRLAIKQLALATGGLLALPAWANAWTRTSLPAGPTLLSTAQADALTAMVDALIPASNTPGAIALGVPDFVQTMLSDCYEPTVQQQVKQGLDSLDPVSQASFGQSFVGCTVAQRGDVLKAIEQTPEAPQKAFYMLVKNLTIQGYTTSEYVMTNFLNYTMVPGHYYGCVPAPVAAK